MCGMTTRVLIAAVAATASLVAACGAEKPKSASSSGNPSQAEVRKAMLDFARCMRQNGVDMPDPKFEGNRGTMGGPGGRPENPDTVRAAEKACAKYRDAVEPPEMS